MGQLQNIQYIYNGNNRRRKRERNRRNVEAMSENPGPESQRTPSKISTLPQKKRQTKAKKLYTLAFYFHTTVNERLKSPEKSPGV